MVQYHRHLQLRKSQDKEEEEGNTSSSFSSAYMKAIPTSFRLLFLFFFFFCFLFSFFFYCGVFSAVFDGSCILPCLCLFGTQEEKEHLPFVETKTMASKISPSSPCSSVMNGSVCCDRTGYRSDICFMKGDIRTSSAKSSIFLNSSNNSNNDTQVVERIRPYTRKWETNVMDTIDELKIITRSLSLDKHTLNTCQVQHSIPAIIFSTGGYTGNVYHEFNDGILPLYVTSQRFNRRVVFVILEYHNWWVSKYGDILAQLSDYPPIDFARDQAVHCFPEAIVGLQIHDELTVTSSLMPNNQTIGDFRNLLDEAYKPRIKRIIKEESQAEAPSANGLDKIMKKPKLVILSRNGSRAIINERQIVEFAEAIGFHVEVLSPTPSTELAKIYRSLNSSDAMLGIHGAAVTHLLFMRPGSVFIQVVPLGTNWAAQTYYGEPAMKLGLEYISYNISPKESSLYGEYEKDDPVLTDPESVTRKGWEETKRVYLDRQNVRIDLKRFREHLVRAYQHSMMKLSGSNWQQERPSSFSKMIL